MLNHRYIRVHVCSQQHSHQVTETRYSTISRGRGLSGVRCVIGEGAVQERGGSRRPALRREMFTSEKTPDPFFLLFHFFSPLVGAMLPRPTLS